MHSDISTFLDEHLAELAADELRWTDDHGGANQNLWMVSVPTNLPITPEELTAFVYRAREVRRGQLGRSAGSPVTFYLWSDDLAGQLRFSVCRRTPDNLPFGCTVELVSDPDAIVREYLESPLRDGIPLSSLTCVDETDDADDDDDDESFTLHVWADRIA